MTMRFTGWHMLLILLLFFGVVIAVNMTMAVLANRTFGGTVVDNGYVASQRYNGWLAAARAQAAAGWRARVSAANGVMRVSLDRGGVPAQGAQLVVIATHPLGRAAPQRRALREERPGSYTATAPLPAGRWLLRIEGEAGGATLAFADEVQA